MSTVKLLNNLPIENLTPETDYLGLIDKGELIKTFLIGNKEQFNEIKMFSLYGEWGSGKSSLMKYLQKELRDDFNTFFFEAWEFEKDENLAMSLLEFITAKNTDAGEAICNDVLKYGGRILRGLGKAVKVNIPLYPNGSGIELDPSAFVEEIDKKEELTFNKALEKFKTEFRRLEDNITRKDKKYNIVFFFFLDRCEPEQVLNLLSAIKLFFTYGEKTIFFCGIDKKAVEEAVKTKYGEIVKANEYLEKIFDISFTMPKHSSIIKLINQYFDDTIYILKDDRLPINERVNQFFEMLNFTNPRRVKKVLNKFQMLRNFKQNWNNQAEIFPNIDEYNREQKSLFETLLVLYLIILHEFHPEFYDDFLNFEKKRAQFSGYSTIMKRDVTSYPVTGVFRVQDFWSVDEDYNLSEMSFNKIYSDLEFRDDDYLAMTLFPFSIEGFYDVEQSASEHLIDQQLLVENVQIDYLFYRFVINNLLYIIEDKYLSQSTFLSVKRIIAKVL